MLLLFLACASVPEPVSSADTSTTPMPTTPPGFDPAAGFERTADGAINRVADVPSSPGDYAYGTGDCYGSLSLDEPECVPGDCTERPNGRCAAESCLTTWCSCVYACTSDADCGPDEACLRPEHGLDAGVPLPTCVPAECRTGADCASGECGVAVGDEQPTQQLRLTCRTPTDTCRADQDCDPGNVCARHPETGWNCVCSHCWCDQVVFLADPGPTVAHAPRGVVGTSQVPPDAGWAYPSAPGRRFWDPGRPPRVSAAAIMALPS